jgi:hypothetical protein
MVTDCNTIPQRGTEERIHWPRDSTCFHKNKKERRLTLGYRRINRYVIRNNDKMMSIHHTLVISSSSNKRLPSKPPAEEPESASMMGKGKQKAIPEAHTSPWLELPFSLETSEGHLWPNTLPTSLHLEKVSWGHLNSIPNRAEGSAVAGGSGQNCQVNHKTPNDTRELPKPLSL